MRAGSAGCFVRARKIRREYWASGGWQRFATLLLPLLMDEPKLSVVPIAARTMAEHDADVSFALIYSISADGSTARLAPGSSDLHDVRWAPPEILLIGNGDERNPYLWPLTKAMDEGMQVLRDIVLERGLPGADGLRRQRWPRWLRSRRQARHPVGFSSSVQVRV